MKRVIFLFLAIMVFIPHNMINAEMSEEEVADIIIEKKHIPYDLVTVTTYTVSAGETDSTPLVTASGYKLDSLNPKRQKVIAISRDLKRKYKFGQKVRVKGAGKLDGVYTVRDVMARRWRKKIDILINPDDDGTKIRKVKLYNIETNDKTLE
jgi:3D (Asp-Asp-Asp) domain-containing protein